MGQLVSVREKPSSNPGVVRYEINRSLTGMGHERYGSLEDIVLDRPVDAVARRLFEHGGVQAVHVNSSVITVYLAGGSTGDGIAEVIENLFRFYGEEDAEVDVESENVDVAEADPESAVESEPDPEVEVEAGAEADPEVDPDVEVEAGAEADPDPDTDPEPAAEADSDAGVDSGDLDGDVPEA